MKSIIKYLSFAAFAMTLSLASCNDDDTNPMEPAYLLKSVELKLSDELRASLYLDETQTQALPLLMGTQVDFGYKTTPGTDEVTFPEMIWTSSDPAVASIDADGRISALKAGSTVITIAPSTINILVAASVKIYVVESIKKATKITITDNHEITDDVNQLPACFIGETMQLTAKIEPSEATYKSVLWSSKNPAIAAIDPISGLITGVSDGKATLVATALDEDKVTTEHEIYIIRSIDPLGIKLIDKPAADAKFSISDNTVSLGYELHPATATKSLVTWTTSDANVATVDRGVVTIKAYGDVTITATCIEGEEALPAGFEKTISTTLSIPAGYYRDHLLNATKLWWAADSNGMTSERKYDNTTKEYYLDFTAGSGSKARGDIRRNSGGKTFLSRTYPILCYRMDDLQNRYPGVVTARNIAMDTSGDVGGVKYSGRIGGAGAQKWQHEYTCSDGSSILIFDLSAQVFQTPGAVMPENVVGDFSTFKIVYADIVPGSSPATIPYRFFWFHTFQTMDEMKAYIQEWSNNTGITYTQKK